jgi:hypothetical protein
MSTQLEKNVAVPRLYLSFQPGAFLRIIFVTGRSRRLGSLDSKFSLFALAGIITAFVDAKIRGLSRPAGLPRLRRPM